MIAKKMKLFLTMLSMLLLGACQTTNDNKFREANSFNPRAAELNVQLAMGYMREGDLSRAKSKLLYALEQDPHSTLALSAMAFYFENTDDVANAETYHLKALRLAPKEGRILNNYGGFLCRQGRQLEAENYFIQATQDINYLSIASAYENAGICAKTIAQQDKAIYYFEKALAKDPNAAQSLENIVQLLVEHRDYPRAQSYYQRYARLVNESPKSLWLGFYLAKGKGDQLEANSYAMRLRALFPESKEAQLLKV